MISHNSLSKHDSGFLYPAGMQARCQQNSYPYIYFPALAHVMNFFQGPMGKSARPLQKV